MPASLGMLMGMGVVLGMNARREKRWVASWKRGGSGEVGRGATATLGWQIVATTGERSSGFLSTLGLWQAWRHPEIVVFAPGQDPAEMIEPLHEIGLRVARGEHFEADKTYVALFGNGPGAFRAIDRRWYEDYLADACEAYRHHDFPALQLVWPDRNGRFPWERHAGENAAIRQPLLAEPSLSSANENADSLTAELEAASVYFDDL